MGESNGDWGWLINDEVLEVASSDVLSTESEHAVLIALLGESNGNWGWLVNDEVLEVTSGHIFSTEGEHAVFVRLELIELDETLSDWGISILDEGNESLFGDVLAVEDTNLGGSWGGCLTLPVWSHVINGVVTIIVWEALIEGLSKGLGSIEWVVKWWSSGGLWDSLDHHGDSDVVVVGEILGLISVLLEDGVEGIVTNDLSERLESNGLDVIKGVSWRDLKSDGFDLIDWDINELGELVEVILGLSFGTNEVAGLWSTGVVRGSLDISLSLWLFVVVLLAVMFFVVLLSL